MKPIVRAVEWLEDRSEDPLSFYFDCIFTFMGVLLIIAVAILLWSWTHGDHYQRCKLEILGGNVTCVRQHVP